MKAEDSFVWPLPLERYDRSKKVTKDELALLRTLLREPWDGRYRKREWFKPLSRILLPLRDAVDAIKGDRKFAEAAVGGLLRETVRREQTLWNWSHRIWVALLGSQAALFKRVRGHRPQWRTGYMAIAYLLQCLGDIRDYGPVKVAQLAHRVFGEQVVSNAETQVLELLRQWGYGKSKAPYVVVCLHELFLINQSPRLQDFTFECEFSASMHETGWSLLLRSSEGEETRMG